jgi:hypothetical protein
MKEVGVNLELDPEKLEQPRKSHKFDFSPINTKEKEKQWNGTDKR